MICTRPHHTIWLSFNYFKCIQQNLKLLLSSFNKHITLRNHNIFCDVCDLLSALKGRIRQTYLLFHWFEYNHQNWEVLLLSLNEHYNISLDVLRPTYRSFIIIVQQSHYNRNHNISCDVPFSTQKDSHQTDIVVIKTKKELI